MRALITASLVCAMAGPALALQEPAPGKLDPRMVTAAYNPAQVFAVHVPQGQTLAITLAATEIATDGFGSDPKLLRSDLSGNVVLLWSGDTPVPPRSVFIRSRTADGKTRTYALLVDTQPADRAALSFTFTYPADDLAAKQVVWRQAAADREQKAAKAALDAASGANDSNVRYGLVVTPVPKVPFWKLRNFNALQPILMITY